MAARPRRGTLRDVDHQIFISYASEDRERAGQLAAALEAEGLTVWWDRKIVAGRQFDRVIEEALDHARCVVVCWTAHSVASEWVKNEAAAGAERDVLVPVRLEAVKLPLEFRRRQTVDLVDWAGQRDAPAFAELLGAVRGLVGGEARGVPATAATPAPGLGRRRAVLAAGGAVALGAAGGGLVLWRPWRGRGSTRPTEDALAAGRSASAAAPAAPVAPVAAVFPTVALLGGAGQQVASALLTPRGYALAMKHTVRQNRPVQLSWPEGDARREAMFEPVRADRIRGEVVLLRPRDGLRGAWPLRVRISRSLRPGEAIERFAGPNNRAPGTVKELFATRTVQDDRGPNQLNELLITTGIAAPGDSGAPVVDASGAVVGLLYGGSRTESVVLPIEDSTISFPEAF